MRFAQWYGMRNFNAVAELVRGAMIKELHAAASGEQQRQATALASRRRRGTNRKERRTT